MASSCSSSLASPLSATASSGGSSNSAGSPSRSLTRFWGAHSASKPFSLASSMACFASWPDENFTKRLSICSFISNWTKPGLSTNQFCKSSESRPFAPKSITVTVTISSSVLSVRPCSSVLSAGLEAARPLCHGGGASGSTGGPVDRIPDTCKSFLENSACKMSCLGQSRSNGWPFTVSMAAAARSAFSNFTNNRGAVELRP
mmetsp:Transcript_70972/g.159373  ORF Transcript_70972/g.159373 Transcript_70972/m.159373 type:complete len:202 (-) Transcript_70972:28-633(-)